MNVVEFQDVSARIDQLLRPLGITRNMKAYRILCDCLLLILEKEDRLECVQKEVYEPTALCHHCKWAAIQSSVRRAAQSAWATNPALLQELAGYPLEESPSAVQFLEMLYNGIMRS